MPTTTAAKFDTIEALATELDWINLAEHEAMMEHANRMWNRGAITDALQTLVDENRAADGLAPVAECTRRISFRDPQYERINVHVELLDGKVKSAAFNYFGYPPVTSLTGIIRRLATELHMAKLRAEVA